MHRSNRAPRNNKTGRGEQNGIAWGCYDTVRTGRHNMMVQGADKEERQHTTGRGGNGRRWMGLICEPRASNIATEYRTRGMRVVGLAWEGSHQPKK